MRGLLSTPLVRYAAWVLLAALLNAALFNTVFYNLHYSDTWLVARSAASSVAHTLPLFFALLWFPRVSLVLLPLVFALGGLASYVITAYQTDIRADTLALLFETDVGEAGQFVDATSVAWVLGALLLGLAVAWFARRTARPRATPAIVVLLAMAGASEVLANAQKRDNIPAPLPQVVAYQTKTYIKEKRRLEQLFSGRRDISEQPFEAPRDDLTVVLVIGESARSDHFGLNGYSRDTTPRLQRLGVVSHPDVLACGNLTRTAVPCMMSRGGIEEPERFLAETSFVSLFRKAEFRTDWISNQRVLHRNDTFITGIAQEAEFYETSYGSDRRSRDDEMVPRLLQVLNGPEPRKLLVYHSIGSHWAYSERYGNTYERFVPDCGDPNPAECTPQELINAYDNSILATDGLLAAIIEGLQDRNALVLYTSDHGESLGERGVFIHGHHGIETNPEQWLTPFVVWASPTFRARYPERYAALTTPIPGGITHSVVFHTLLDCAGFRTPLVSPAKSLCSVVDGQVAGQARRPGS
jgi:glucan phosphoethanolaminetransferase (alkaline phosphatase superfamily)